MTALADMGGGNKDNGKAVIRRNCIACHKLYNEGAAFGPDYTGIGKRLTKFQIVQSIIDPNAEIDKKYLSTQVVDVDGKTTSGLLVKEDANAVVIFDGKIQKTIAVEDIVDRKTLNQSSMPEGLGATMSPGEFLDVIEFLSSLK